MIVRPTGPGPHVASVEGRVHTAVGPSGLGNGLQDDGQVANVSGYASRLSPVCGERASTAIDPEVIASDLAGGCRVGHGHDFDGDSTDGDLIVGDSTGYSDIASGFAVFVKAAVGDFGDAAGNVTTVASTCARRRLFGTADEENLVFNADPCSARRLQAGDLILAAMSETFGCRRLRDACCCSFVRDILQPAPSAGLGLALRAVASGTTCLFTADGPSGHSLCCVGTIERRRVRDACCGLVWDSLQPTTCAGWELLAVRSAVGDVGGSRRSLSGCRPSSRRRRERLWTRPDSLRAGRLAHSVVLERFVAVASGTRAVVDVSGTVHSR